MDRKLDNNQSTELLNEPEYKSLLIEEIRYLIKDFQRNPSKEIFDKINELTKKLVN